MIRAVSRQLKGPVQKNFQNLDRLLIPYSSQPIAFDATDFTCKHTSLDGSGTVTTGCRLYQYDTSTPPVLNVISNFSKTSLIGNPFWAGMNQDIPDGGCYTPIRVTYNINVRGAPLSVDNCRVRIDLFSAKPRAYIPGTVPLDVVMPHAFKHMKNMADGDTINRINSEYFKKYRTKTIYLNSRRIAQGSAIATTQNERWFKLHIHPKKDRTQNVTNPIDPLDPRPEVAEGNFGYLNTPLDEPLWMMISTTDDQGASSGDWIEVNISRECVWRDKVGSSKLM